MTPEDAAKAMTKEDLEEALAIKRRDDAPPVLTYINPNPFILFAQSEVESVVDGTYTEESSTDDNQAAYEIIMKAVYGEGIFDWMESKQ